jgi:uncharacterized protein (DUF305 family)
MANQPNATDTEALVEEDEVTEPTPLRRGFFVPLPGTVMALSLLAVVVIGIGVLAWQLWPRDPAGDSAEAGFLRDMYNHHAQAVEMAMIIRDRTSDEGLHTLATEIALGQSTQMGTMLGLLQAWDIPQGTTELPMTWMGHPTEGLMPGMATQEEIDQLSSLPVDQAEVLFLQLMIRHHQGGVEMANAYLDRGSNDDVILMAERIVLFQQNEIDAMNLMLEQRGEAPITDPLPDDHAAH